ncbi:hypothetical protein EST38_g6802 [Candolleomyces aberdarensis]|uniref:Uncharacterized protein n=1 Tax=Candolleomyces aberdarensis TaxID=2316362 RepID=A0A4Q2DGR3_9AGAR|nr:hypothetical protein EST38_g6802 [Candolleomyces aberdarensis]
MLAAAPLSLSGIESSSGQRTHRNIGSSSSLVSTHADSEVDPESITQLLEPISVRNIIVVYQVAFQKASDKPSTPNSPVNYELEAATLLVEVVLDNYDRLCEESRRIVDEYIEWDPHQS